MKKRVGLTLIETLTILAILAILTTLIVTATGGLMQKQREVRIDADMAMIAQAAISYRAMYPGEIPTMQTLVESGSLVKPLDSPVEGYDYVLKASPEMKTCIVTLEKGGHVYVRGPFRAEIHTSGIYAS